MYLILVPILIYDPVLYILLVDIGKEKKPYLVRKVRKSKEFWTAYISALNY